MHRLFAILGFFFVVWLLPSHAQANPYSKAEAAYEKGSYSKAYKLAAKAADKASGKSSRAKAVALMGAAATKMGKGSKASDLFRKARKLDSDVELPSAASDDNAVKKLFARSGGGSSKSIAKGKPRPGDFNNYLPGGLPQLKQGKTVLGATLGGAQAAGLILFLYNKQSEAAAEKGATDAKTDFDSLSPAEQDKDKADFLDYLDQNEAYVLQMRQYEQIGLLLLFGGYGLSVVDALFDPLHLAKQSAAQVETDSDESFADLEDEDNVPDQASWNTSLSVLPVSGTPILLHLSYKF